MSSGGKKKKQLELADENQPRRRVAMQRERDYEDLNMHLGRTIAGEREKMESESERQLLREKEQKKKKMSAAIYVAVFLVVVAGIFLIVRQVMWFQENAGEREEQAVVQKYTPTVEIIDEGDTKQISEKTKKYVGMLEQDLVDVGLKAERVVLPAGKTREVDVYVAGRKEYYKCNLDRGTAVSAEDISRMVKYLAERGLEPTYVDVRVEGRAYYK